MEHIAARPDAECSPKSEALDLMESEVPQEACVGVEVAVPANISAKTTQVEDSDASSIDDQDELLPRPVRKKRPNRRYTEWSSDDEYCLRALKRSFPKYRDADSSSESESDCMRPSRDTALKPTGLPIGVVRGCPKCSDCQAVLARWRPEAGCKPSMDDAPVFYPNEEEFKDTLKYIAKIRPAAEPYGICRVVPPPGWRPPCPLREDTAKLHVLKFPTRVQEIHKLQVREAVKKCAQAKSRPGGRRGRGGFRGRMGRPIRRTPSWVPMGGSTKPVQPDESFGFEPGSYFSLGMFEKYAHQFKQQYFLSAESADEALDPLKIGDDSASSMYPSVDAIEGEYWRIVEQPTDRIEVLYGADVETGSFGSGFPKAKPGEVIADPDSYENSGWNLNNIARLPGSMLGFEEGDISGVLVPWLYIGMCFSSFCWHVEDHHFYSLNYMHWGAPKVWYGVPGHAAPALETVMKKHLPDLFNEQPDLLHKLVTQLSPTILKGEGLPVYRLVQQAGEFVITFPRAYHSGFNCGFNCAEAVNVAPVDWLPHGQSAVELYREQRRKTSVSHDKLLLSAAMHAVKMCWQSGGEQGMQKPQGQVIKQEVHQELESAGTSGCDKEMVYAWQAFCGQGGLLVKALKERVQMERVRQAALVGVVHMKKMDRYYDATDERECSECHYDLHLSAVGCECSPEKYVCLPHAKLLCGCQWGTKSVLYRYDLVQLELLVAVLEDKPGALSAWFQQGHSSSSASSVSANGLFPQPAGKEAVMASTIGTSEFESTGNFLGSGNCSGKDSEFNLASRRDCLTTKPVNFDTNGKSILRQWSQGTNTQLVVPHEQTVGHFVNNIAQVQSAPHSAVTVLEDSNVSIGVQTRGQWGLYCKGKRPPNSVVKIETQITETSVSSSRQEVIVLSDDDEDGTRRTSFGQANILGEVEGTALHTSTSTMVSDVSLSKESVEVRESKNTGLVTQPFHAAQNISSCGLQHNFGSAGLQPSVNASSTTLGSFSKPHTHAVPLSTGDSRVNSSYPSRVRSIGSLKQQARAGNSHHVGSASRLLTARVDPFHRAGDALTGVQADLSHPAQNGHDVGQTDQCGNGQAGGIQPSTFIQSGSATQACHANTADSKVPALMQAGAVVQSRTPTRLERPSGPRVAKVLRKKLHGEVELLHVGALVMGEGWQSKHSILPAGFKSRVRFCNVMNISQTCLYISEILDGGQTGPQFKVTVEGSNAATFLEDSIDSCWQMVQDRINEEIIRCRGLGQCNLPALQPPQSLHGLDMFGLTSPTIIQAVEALDPHHLCVEYWSGKLQGTAVVPAVSCLSTTVNSCAQAAAEHRPSTPEEAHVLRPKVSGTHVGIASRPMTPSTEALLLSKGALVLEYPARAKIDYYSILKGFYQKGSWEELWALHRLFSCDWQGKEWREGFQALTDVLDIKNP